MAGIFQKSKHRRPWLWHLTVNELMKFKMSNVTYAKS
jgi:hypothetical protein